MQYTDVVVIHITHVDNLASILSDGCLYSDAKNISRNSCKQQIGMTTIKQRRLELDVRCHPGTKVGQYVPFYFWHHSPMLYLIHKHNEDLEYDGGQADIIHLVSTMEAGVAWAEGNKKKWAFTTSNAGAYYCDFYCDPKDLDQVNWTAVQEKYWSQCKEEKQAEFLVQDRFPFELFRYVVVMNDSVRTKVNDVLAGGAHQPMVVVQRDWYYV